MTAVLERILMDEQLVTTAFTIDGYRIVRNLGVVRWNPRWIVWVRLCHQTEFFKAILNP